MAVIINDFEVIIDPPDKERETPPQPEQQRQAQLAMTPADLRGVTHHLSCRALRLLAH